jgi:hypothetical protein
MSEVTIRPREQETPEAKSEEGAASGAPTTERQHGRKATAGPKGDGGAERQRRGRKATAKPSREQSVPGVKPGATLGEAKKARQAAPLRPNGNRGAEGIRVPR